MISQSDEPDSQQSPQTWLSKLPALAIVTALIAGSWWLSQRTVPSPNTPAQPAPTQAFRPVDSSDHIRGRPDAPYTLIEYGDIACRFCQVYHPTVRKLLAEHPDDIRWVWRWFPHDVNVDAYKKAEAAECAAEQEHFWEFIDAVFVAGVDLTVAELSEVANIVGLDVQAFERCVASGKYEAKVQAHVAEASRLGGQATPFTLIMTPDNHVYPIAGVAEYEQLNGLLSDLLEGKPPSFQYP